MYIVMMMYNYGDVFRCFLLIKFFVWRVCKMMHVVMMMMYMVMNL